MGNSLNKSSKHQSKQSTDVPKKPCTSCKCKDSEDASAKEVKQETPPVAVAVTGESNVETPSVAEETTTKEPELERESGSKSIENVDNETLVTPVLVSVATPVTAPVVAHVTASDATPVDADSEPKSLEVREFSIANKKLKLTTAEDAAEYVAAIKALPNVKVIALNGNTLGVEASKSLAEAINACDFIEEFYLNDCFTGRMKEEVDVAVEAFGQVLKTKSTLRIVDFSDNAFGPVGAKAAAVLFSEATSLRELILNNNGLGPEGGKTIAQSLIDCQKLNTEAGRESSLRRVEIGRNRLENGSALLFGEAFKAHGSLEDIALPQNGIRPEGIAELATGISTNVKLNKLNLQDNTFTSTGSKAFAAALEKLTVLKVLNVGDCLLGSDGCEMTVSSLVASGCPIESLNLQFNEMNEKGLEHFVRNLCKFSELKVLMLNGNCFNPNGLAAESLKEALQLDQRADILDSWSEMEFYSDEEDLDLDSEAEKESTGSVGDDLADKVARMNIDKTD